MLRIDWSFRDKKSVFKIISNNGSTSTERFEWNIITQSGERISVNFKSVERYLDISIDSRLAAARRLFSP